MEYFRLRQDPRTQGAILFRGLINQLSYQDIRSGTLDKLDELTVMSVPSSRYNQYPDLLSRQIFAISKALKEVFDLFQMNLTYKRICAMDLPNRQHVYYFAPTLPIRDCYSSQSRANFDRSVIEQLVLRQQSLDDCDIFRVSEVLEHTVVVTLPVAECILRRKLVGIQLMRIYFES